MNTIMETIWCASVLEIEQTVSNVCDKLFNDCSVDFNERKIRAEAILQLGKIFVTAKSKNPDDAKLGSKQRMTEALRKAMAAANGQDL